MTQERYLKFVIDNYTTVHKSTEGEEGLVRVKNDISEVDMCENRNSIYRIESLYSAITELFEIHNIELQYDGEAVGFFIIQKDEGETKHGIDSPWLCREKLKTATPDEVAGAMIDILLHRNKWTEEKSYTQLHI